MSTGPVDVGKASPPAWHCVLKGLRVLGQCATGIHRLLSATIFQRVRSAALKKVKERRCGIRTGFRGAFTQEEHRWPTLACLAGNRRQGAAVICACLTWAVEPWQPTIISTEEFMSMLEKVRWSVVEQKHFVACGRDEFQDEYLRFHEIRSGLSCGRTGGCSVPFRRASVVSNGPMRCWQRLRTRRSGPAI